MSLEVLNFQRQIDRLEEDYETLKGKFEKLNEIILSDRLLDDDKSFHKALSEFSSHIVTSPAITRALLESQYAQQYLQEAIPQQQQQEVQQEPQTQSKLGVLHLVVIGVALSIVFLAVYNGLLPPEFLFFASVATVFLTLLPFFLPLLEKKMPKLKAAEEPAPKTVPEWISRQIAEMRKRYTAEYLLVRLQQTATVRIKEYDRLPEEVKVRKTQRLIILRKDFLGILDQIMVLVNESVREQINYLNSCMVAQRQSRGEVAPPL